MKGASRSDQSTRSAKLRVLTLPVIAVAGTSLLLAACSSSNKSTTSAATNAPATTAAPAATTAPASMSEASVTVKAANVAGVGTALVDGDGHTLYVLASEKGGKVTCTASGGCTTIWPPVLLPSGMMHGIAGSGVQASLLGTVNGPGGDVRLTYAGWPLYTFSEDTSSNPAKGQGVKDSYGQWWALSPSGSPITTAAAASSPPTTSGASTGGAGF